MVTHVDAVSGQALRGSVLFMKSNSTGDIYMKFGGVITDNKTKYKGIYDMSTNSSNPHDVSIVDIPSVTNDSTIVDYKITATSNVRGIYGIPLGNCGLSPLAIGLDENEVDVSVLFRFFTQTYPCAVYDPKIDGVVTNYSGITNNVVVLDMSKISPLKQLRIGVPQNDLKCKEGFVLAFKNQVFSPACLKPETFTKLKIRGWAFDPNNPIGHILVHGA
jgi:hypothetical protein